MTIDFGFFAPAQLGDVVWYDDNHNGIQDNNESGVEGVKVYLLDSNGSNILNSDGESISAVTDENGTYLFVNLLAGSYSVAFDLATLPDGYGVTLVDEGDDDTIDSDANRTTGIIPATLLNAGDSNLSLDMGIVKVGAIKGTVTYQEDDGSLVGLEGVELVLYDSNGNEIARTVTNEDGNYTFDNLVPNSYIIKEIQPSGYDDLSENEGGGEADENTTTTEINEIFAVVSDGEIDISNDFVELKEVETTTTTTTSSSSTTTTTTTTSTQEEEEQKGNWYGNVSEDVDSDNIGDIPIEGVEIALYIDENGDGELSDSERDSGLVATTKTDENGDYRFEDLSAGNYIAVETQPDGYIDVSENEGGEDDDISNSTINQIAGVVDEGEDDRANDFVERKKEEVVESSEDENSTTSTTQEEDTNSTTIVEDENNETQTATIAEDQEPSSTLEEEESEDSNSEDLIAQEDTVEQSQDLDEPTTIQSDTDTSTQQVTELVVQEEEEEIQIEQVTPEVVTTQDTTQDNSDEVVAQSETTLEEEIQDNELTPTENEVESNDTQDLEAQDQEEEATIEENSTPVAQEEEILLQETEEESVQESASVCIGNRVWDDINRNGIQDSNELGVEGVMVRLYSQDCQREIDSQVTNSQGEYIFSELDPESYCLEFSSLPADYVITVANRGDDDSLDSDANPETSRIVDISPRVDSTSECDNSWDVGIYENQQTEELIAYDDFVPANPKDPVTVISVLDNDAISSGVYVELVVVNSGDVIESGETVVAGTSITTTRELYVEGEGTWKVEDNGTIVFIPDPDFDGVPTPIYYIVKDEKGNQSNIAQLSIVTECTCEPYVDKSSVDIYSNSMTLIMLILSSMILGLFYMRKEKVEP